jgi:hypothetical protein
MNFNIFAAATYGVGEELLEDITGVKELRKKNLKLCHKYIIAHTFLC